MLHCFSLDLSSTKWPLPRLSPHFESHVAGESIVSTSTVASLLCASSAVGQSICNLLPELTLQLCRPLFISESAGPSPSKSNGPNCLCNLCRMSEVNLPSAAMWGTRRADADNSHKQHRGRDLHCGRFHSNSGDLMEQPRRFRRIQPSV